VFIALLIYYLFFFAADLKTDPDARVKMGWWMIGTLSLALLMAFMYFWFLGISSIVRFCKLKLKRRKNQKKQQIKVAKAKKAAEERKRVIA
jgi:hypothetical protein